MAENKIEGYCVKCKAKKEIKDPVNYKMKCRGKDNKKTRPAVKGVCPKCGTGMFRIGASV